MMIEPGWKVYRGMIVGETHARQRPRDQRAQEASAHQHPHHLEGRAVRSPRRSGCRLEKALAYIGDDELVEVTPKSIRPAQEAARPNERKRADRCKEPRRSDPRHLSSTISVYLAGRSSSAGIFLPKVKTPRGIGTPDAPVHRCSNR